MRQPTRAGWPTRPANRTTPSILYCADGFEWSDGSVTFKDVTCKAASDGSCAFYLDNKAQIEVSCDLLSSSLFSSSLFIIFKLYKFLRHSICAELYAFTTVWSVRFVRVRSGIFVRVRSGRFLRVRSCIFVRVNSFIFVRVRRGRFVRLRSGRFVRVYNGTFVRVRRCRYIGTTWNLCI